MSTSRTVVAWLWVCLMLPAAPCAIAQGGAWKPEKNVAIIAPVAKGGGTDTTARLVERVLREQRLVDAVMGVVNKSEGGGAETWAYLASVPGNGHYLAIITPPLLIGANAPRPAAYTPLTLLYSEYVMIAVRADSPIKTGRDLAARLKKDASSVSLAVAPALGSHNHLAPALVARAAGGEATKMRVEIFRTGTAAADAVIAGRADLVSSSIGTLLSRVGSGQLRPLGLTAAKRLGGPLAAVPTWKEQGLDVVLPSWRGVIGPGGLSREQVAYWEAVFLKLSFDDRWLTELRKQWWESAYLNNSETLKFLQEQQALLNSALRRLDLAP